MGEGQGKPQSSWTPKPDWKVKGRFKIGRPRRYKDPQELLDKAAEYFESCVGEDGELKEPITITGLCNYIGTYRSKLIEYESGSLESLKDGSGDDEAFRAAIKHIKSVCEQYAESHMFSARNPAGSIFALKNYNWKDTQTIETTVTEIHTLDPEVRQLVGEYHRQLLAAQRTAVIDITPRQLPEPQKVESGAGSTPAPGRGVDKLEDNKV